MKKFGCIMCIFVALSLCGCNNDYFDSNIEQGCDTITATITDTRTSLGTLENGIWSLLWSEGDSIAANGQSSHDVEMSSDTKVATFSFEDDLTYPCDILYPASFYTNATSITLPAIQEVAVGTFATNTLPMSAKISQKGDNAELQHLMSVLCIPIKQNSASDGDNDAIKRVEFRGKNEEQLSGLFTIDYASATLTPTTTNTEECLKVRVNRGLSTTDATNVYIVVPAQEYKSGFVIRIIDTSGHFQDVEKLSGTTLSKGVIVTMPEVVFKPTGTIIEAEIQ